MSELPHNETAKSMTRLDQLNKAIICSHIGVGSKWISVKSVGRKKEKIVIFHQVRLYQDPHLSVTLKPIVGV